MGTVDPRCGLTSWCEVDADALRANIRVLRERLTRGALLGVVVKSNGYGHGMVACAREFLEAGADWLVVNALAEARSLRDAGIEAPVYVCGGVLPEQSDLAVRTAARVVVYDRDSAVALDEAGRRSDEPVRVHLKVETGIQRQGIPHTQAVEFALWLSGRRGVVVEGLTTHYADIDNTADPSFAMKQLHLLEETREAIASKGVDVPMVHSANSAGALLWPQTHGSLVRVGIAAYGLWPSMETQAEAVEEGGESTCLLPALSWRARVVQVKEVAAGATIGYGRTYRATHAMRVGVLPVGYYEGYDRRLSNLGHVLIHGIRAPVLGRVCMNMTVVDVTHVPAAQAGSVATLLGRDGEEEVSADLLASWMGTINYEVVARIHPEQPRFVLRNGSLV